jgi:hypothetical protein
MSNASEAMDTLKVPCGNSARVHADIPALASDLRPVAFFSHIRVIPKQERVLLEPSTILLQQASHREGIDT